MDCEQALVLISAALDGEITETERAMLEEHLSHCPECRAVSEDFGVISVALSDMMADPPADLTVRINAVLDERDEREKQVEPAPAPKKIVNWKRWGSLAAMFAVVVCLGGVFVFSDLGGAGTSDCAAPEASYGHSSADMALEPAVSAGVEEAAPAEGITDVETGAMREVDDSVTNDFAFFETDEQISPAIDTDLTAADGAQLVFDYLGGTEHYPDAVWSESDTGYILEQTETEKKSFKAVLRYTGLSEDGWYYTFQLYHETMDEVFATCSFVSNYAVKLDGSEILEEPLG